MKTVLPRLPAVLALGLVCATPALADDGESRVNLGWYAAQARQRPDTDRPWGVGNENEDWPSLRGQQKAQGAQSQTNWWLPLCRACAERDRTVEAPRRPRF